MPFLILVLAYLLGSIPTAYIAGRLVKGKDIREMVTAIWAPRTPSTNWVPG